MDSVNKEILYMFQSTPIVLVGILLCIIGIIVLLISIIYCSKNYNKVWVIVTSFAIGTIFLGIILTYVGMTSYNINYKGNFNITEFSEEKP